MVDVDTIPVIDFGLYSENEDVKSKENNLKIAKEIHDAMHKIGFMYITNHGIDQQKVDKAFESSQKFFELPMSEKEKYLVDMKKEYSGYTKPNQEILSGDYSYELRESWGLAPSGKFKVVDQVPDLDPLMQDLRSECHPLLNKIFHLFGKALELEDPDFFQDHHNIWAPTEAKPNVSVLRSNFYPKIPEDLKVEKESIRCAEHTDYGTITLLFQDSIGGLEVKNANGSWVQAPPIPGSILVNTGDAMGLWTQNYFPATLHRVTIPEQEIKKRSIRQSIAYFVWPDYQTIIRPLKSSLNLYGDGPTFSEISFSEHAQKKLLGSYKQ